MVQITVRMPAELYGRLKETAKRKGMSLNGLILSILWRKAGEKIEI